MITVIKANGTPEPFSLKKFKRSLQLAGIAAENREKAVEFILKNSNSKITTQQLYKQTFNFLKILKQSYARNYSLKHALQMLGPTGFSFEYLTAEIFKNLNYTTHRNQIIQGLCITHEIDIMAYNKNTDQLILIECKFRNEPGIFLGIQIPLYVKSRLDDVRTSSLIWKNFPLKNLFQCAIATNAKLSTQSIQYAECKNIKLLGWNYPHKAGIAELIKRFKLYPITILINLTQKEKKLLLKHNIILCKDLKEEHTINKLKQLKISDKKITRIIKELKEII